MGEGLILVARFGHFAATMALFGAALFPLYAAPGGSSARWLGWAALAALATGLLWLGCLIAGVGDGLSSLVSARVVSAVIFKTHFGPVFALRLVLAAGLALIAFRPPTDRWHGLALAAGAGVLLASLAAIGHGAMGRGAVGAVRLTVQALHLLAGGAWLGALVPLGALARSAVHGDPGRLRTAAAAFSDVAVYFVAIVLVTGIANAAFLLPSLGALVTSAYGRILCVKLSLVAALVALAAFNRVVLVPALPQIPALARFNRSVIAEQSLGVLIVAAVSLLGNTPPPMP